jgi:energy-coupling factor transport system permease protein
MDAQRLRGAAAFEKGTVRQKLKAYRSLAIPLVLGAMRKAQYAGIAMDSRAFGAYRTRTWLTEIKMKREDFLAFAASIVFSAVILTLNFAL